MNPGKFFIAFRIIMRIRTLASFSGRLELVVADSFVV